MITAAEYQAMRDAAVCRLFEEGWAPKDIGRKYGISGAHVRSLAKREGWIVGSRPRPEAAPPPVQARRPSRQLALTPQPPAQTIAEIRRLIAPRKRARPKRRRRKPAPAYARFSGTATDREIANRFGVRWRTVYEWRRRHGIAAFKVHDPVTPAPPPPPEWAYLVGMAADTSVARLYGVSPSAVARRRRKLGIPAYRRPKAERPKRALWAPSLTVETAAEWAQIAQSWVDAGWVRGCPTLDEIEARTCGLRDPFDISLEDRP